MLESLGGSDTWEEERLVLPSCLGVCINPGASRALEELTRV